MDVKGLSWRDSGTVVVPRQIWVMIRDIVCQSLLILEYPSS